MVAFDSTSMQRFTTDDGKKIALYADGVAHFTEGPPVGDLRETVTMTTSEPDYAWVNPLQIWARGTVDLAKDAM